MASPHISLVAELDALLEELDSSTEPIHAATAQKRIEQLDRVSAFYFLDISLLIQNLDSYSQSCPRTIRDSYWG
jgi:hypothetical protein